MKAELFDEVRRSLLDAADKIQVAKRPGYTVSSEDVLANFKAVAERAGMTARQAWLVYFLKHVDALTAWGRFPEGPQAEAIWGRFADIINYAQLGYAIEIEESQAEQLARAEQRLQHVAQTAHPSFSSPVGDDGGLTNEFLGQTPPKQEQREALKRGKLINFGRLVPDA